MDTTLKDLEISGGGAKRTHRTYTREFKAELVAACQKAGTSIALTVPAASAKHVPAPAAPPLTIRIEAQRANTTIVVRWPLQGAAFCAQWLRECLP